MLKLSIIAFYYVLSPCKHGVNFKDDLQNKYYSHAKYIEFLKQTTHTLNQVI